MLILPEGVKIEFARNRTRLINRRMRTGVFVTCPACGYEWERGSRKEGKIRCHKCGITIQVERIEKGEA
jgi:ribosomal protein S27E